MTENSWSISFSGSPRRKAYKAIPENKRTTVSIRTNIINKFFLERDFGFGDVSTISSLSFFSSNIALWRLLSFENLNNLKIKI